MTKTPRIFEETRTASGLLSEFSAMTRKSKPVSIPASLDPSSDFFNKDYLTMADFMKPVGAIIRQGKLGAQHAAISTVGDFLSSSLKMRKPFVKEVVEEKPWIPDEEISIAMVPSKPSRIQTIAEFLSHL